MGESWHIRKVFPEKGNGERVDLASYWNLYLLTIIAFIQAIDLKPVKNVENAYQNRTKGTY